MTKENLEVDQKCRDDFNAWYWNCVRSKEGKKYLSKDVGTCGGVEIRKFHLVSTKNTSLDITFVS